MIEIGIIMFIAIFILLAILIILEETPQ